MCLHACHVKLCFTRPQDYTYMRSTATYGTTPMRNRWGVCLHLRINAQREAACACGQDAILD